LKRLMAWMLAFSRFNILLGLLSTFRGLPYALKTCLVHAVEDRVYLAVSKTLKEFADPNIHRW